MHLRGYSNLKGNQPHLLLLLIRRGGEGGAAVLRDVHAVHYLRHPLPELVALPGGQQPVQNHVPVLRVLQHAARGKESTVH